MSGQIFISYRREDSKAWAGRLSDHLSNRFPSYRIFMDVDSIEPGEDFVKAIEKTVGACDVLIAVVGKSWLAASNQEGQRRLDNPEDLVRTEIATALKRDIRVIPILVDGASMPHSQDLPDDLKGLARRNALQLSHDRFRSDSALLESAIERILENRTPGHHERGENERIAPEPRALSKPSISPARPEAGKLSAEIPKMVYPPPRQPADSKREKPPERIRETSRLKLLIPLLIMAAVLALGGLIYLATRPLQSPLPQPLPTPSNLSPPAIATPGVNTASSPAKAASGGSVTSPPAKAAPVISKEPPKAQASLGGDVTAMLDSARILNDGMKSLEVFMTFENRSTGEVAVYIGNPMGQSGPPFQVLAVSLTDNSGMPYQVHSLEGVTALADGSLDPHRIYNGLNRYVVVPSKGAAQIRFVFWPNRAPPEPPRSIDLTAEFRVLTDPKNRRSFDKTSHFPDFKVGTDGKADSDESNAAEVARETAKDRRPKSLNGDITATLDSVKVLNVGQIWLEIYVSFQNQSPDEIAVYIGNPMGQNGPPFQVLATSLTDGSGMPYEVRSVEGVTVLADGSADPHRIYHGTNRYVIVPPKDDAQVRFVFWPNRALYERPDLVDFTAELRVVTDLKNRQMFDRALRFSSIKIGTGGKADFEEGNAPGTLEALGGRRPRSLGGDITAKVDSVKVLNDGWKSLEIFMTFNNQSAGEVAIYVSNPMNQSSPPFQIFSASVSDNSGMPYGLNSIEGVTTLPAESADPHRIYNGLNRYVIVPSKGDAQVRLVFAPNRVPSERPTSLNFTAELRILTDPVNRQGFDRTLNVLNCQVN